MENKPNRMFLKEEQEKKIRYLKRKQSEEEAEKALSEYFRRCNELGLSWEEDENKSV